MTKNTPTKPTIAFVGTGRMGAPMATHLLQAGFSLRVWNRSPEHVAPLVALGATSTSSPAQAATGADVIVTMLPDGPVVGAAMRGPQGAFDTLHRGAVWIQMSSIGVEWTDQFREEADHHGVTFVDAPVSGSVGPAQSGTLLVLASGPQGVREQVAPLFDAMSRRTMWLGEAGAGSKAKLVLNNWLVGLVESIAETLHFTKALGLDPELVIELLEDAPIGSPYAVAKARQMLAADFAPSFPLKLALKDADLAVASARGAGVDLKVTNGFIDSWHRALENGLGDEDLSVVYASSAS
jgi:3-hydroxyisobutyrate dehydrogenase